MGKFSNADTANHGGDSTSQASAAGHHARDQATKDGVFERGNNALNSTPFSKLEGCADAKESAGGFWSSIFGK